MLLYFIPTLLPYDVYKSNAQRLLLLEGSPSIFDHEEPSLWPCGTIYVERNLQVLYFKGSRFQQSGGTR